MGAQQPSHRLHFIYFILIISKLSRQVYKIIKLCLTINWYEFKDALLMCDKNRCVVINQQGAVKSSRLSPTEFSFDFEIEYLVSLTDSFLAFHSHGIQVYLDFFLLVFFSKKILLYRNNLLVNDFSIILLFTVSSRIFLNLLVITITEAIQKLYDCSFHSGPVSFNSKLFYS